MEYTTLGNTGTTVSRLCFGTWRFAKESGGTVETDREEAHDLLDAAWEQGINFIDTANVYGDPNGTSEEWIGEWLEDRDVHREDVVIASKVYFPFDGRGEPGPNDSGLGRKHIRAQIEGTLERLGTDYLDVYYIHRWDEDTPIRETMQTLTELVREGKVRYLGASTMAAWQLTKALWTSDVEGLERFDVTQPMVNAAQYDEVGDYLDVCADQDLAVCPYSPLSGGFLTGKYDRAEDGSVEAPDGSRGSLDEMFDDYYATEQAWDVLEAVESVAEEVDASPAQVSLRWLMDQDRFTCVPIVGARTPEQLEENVGAVEVDLSDEQFERIDAARGSDE
ncbi:aldo/keto reductase [Haloterrigena turkmenica DSM 5511]|uniref:Aldo/keto reductase n=1 Tax=Haloterrigena turkmenica (strain ATCC 51198 / DSM 5511 / JCM 9101 / NCIMB 13204 / VKM B-1734 / 4k) TaxID=543526 RepID=D2RZF0_HALTV|nr:aldo/keto reductase [Haloterrigena turkmenica]ADB60074.1 aldo/keto reductase [Haloterrigena turkmenica DSM 5511]